MTANPMKSERLPLEELVCVQCGDTNYVEEATELCADCYRSTFGAWPDEDGSKPTLDENWFAQASATHPKEGQS